MTWIIAWLVMMQNYEIRLQVYLSIVKVQHSERTRGSSFEPAIARELQIMICMNAGLACHSLTYPRSILYCATPI